jgi:CRISPR-associated endoribonuclease Cas6
MPHSLVLNLVPQSPIYPDFLTGRHYHALFLQIVSSVDRALGDRLHEQKTDKAFTLSPLQTQMPRERRGGGLQSSLLQFNHDRPIPAGTPCWWRISLLDDLLFGHLTKLWLNLNPQQAWHLGSADLQITSVLGTPQAAQPWANFVPYGQLYEQASERSRQIDLTFYTPTNFRQGKVDTPLPDRDRVFHSLLRKWNQYSGQEFSEGMIETIFPSYFNIGTAIAPDSRSQFVGGVGEMSFRIFGAVEPVVIKQINALADFALYAGVGRKTPMGMGMVRRVHVRS